MRWKVLGLVVFAVVVAVFTLINTTTVTVDFLFAKAQVSLVLVILLSLLLGMILMAILWSLRAWQLRGQRNDLRRKLTELERALETAEAQHAALADATVAEEASNKPDNGAQSDTAHSADDTPAAVRSVSDGYEGDSR